MNLHYNKTEVLRKFGLSQEESSLYLLLLAGDKFKVSELRRETDYSRSKVESILDELISIGLVQKHWSDKTYSAENPKKLVEILKKQKKSLEHMKSTLYKVVNGLKDSVKPGKATSKVLYYEGVEGLRKVMWNSSKVEGTLRLFEVEEFSQYLDYGFYEKIREIYADNNVESRELSNQKSMPGWTNVEKYVENWEPRYIDPQKIKMNHEMMIYNDVFVLYYGNELGISCVEIYNSKLAGFQKQLFDFMWNRSQRMKILDDKGKSKLVRD